MNEFEPVSARQIDRLVDGELNSVERRAVLLALDRDSDGWRRLALAFLESQGLREALQREPAPTAFPVTFSKPTLSQTPKAIVPRSTPSSGKRQPVLLAAMCGMLIFGLGRISAPVSDPSRVAVAPSPNRQQAPMTDEMNRSDDTPDIEAEDESVQLAGTNSVFQQTMRFEFGDGSGRPVQSVEVPVVENSGITPEELLSAPPLVSDSDHRALLMSGRRVSEQRELVEVILDDGRRGMLPISKVQVEDLGWDAFQ